MVSIPSSVLLISKVTREVNGVFNNSFIFESVMYKLFEKLRTFNFSLF